MNASCISVYNARTHNLKGVNLTIKKGELIAFTGVSGSGKSSLAFDTIYVEGQRRYIESLSIHARRRLGTFPKPAVDKIDGLTPTIAIEQKSVGSNPRSTIGTITGIYDLLRVLFAKIAIPHCPISKEEVVSQSKERIVQEIALHEEGTIIYIFAPHGKMRKEDVAEMQRKGFMRFWHKKCLIDLAEIVHLDPYIGEDIDILIDRLVWHKEQRHRLMESVALATEYSKGLCKIYAHEKERLFSEYAYSPISGKSYAPLEPQDFSFNHPHGYCPECLGLGVSQVFDIERIIDQEKSIAEDCCCIASSFQTMRYGNIYTHLAMEHHASVYTRWKDLPTSLQTAFLHGNQEEKTLMRFFHQTKGTWTEWVTWKGVLKEAKERYTAAKSTSYKKKMKEYLHEVVCPLCRGARIQAYPAAATLGGMTISMLTHLSLHDLSCFFSCLSLSQTESLIGGEIVKEILDRLIFLKEVGVSYLTLDRIAPSLSGGEGQRVRLASQLGSCLVGATYILDEPSIGLHPSDHQKLLYSLQRLRDIGNTVLVVEHDEETIRYCDTIVDMGPLAGSQGGTILVQGTLQEMLACKESITAAYLARKVTLPCSRKRKIHKEKQLVLHNASMHNVHNETISIPLGLFVAVTGVSGSGKSSLIIDTLYPALVNHLHGSQSIQGPYRSLTGHEHLDRVIVVDQTPIGRTPRSNPATYIKLFEEIRDLFASLPESRARGFSSSHFSFNLSDGCCHHCQGMGMIPIDMDFLYEEWEICPMCQGKRFDEMTLRIYFKGKTIHDILEMTIEEAHTFFKEHPLIEQKLDTLMRVGLGYMKLGQPAPELSGGEAQRIKLAKELARPRTGKTLYILDEPSTGLHARDVHRLIDVLQSFVDKGNTVLVIEHHMGIVQAADHLIDLGPGAGDLGGKILFAGSLAQCMKTSILTALALKAYLHQESSSYTAMIPIKPHTTISVKGAKEHILQNIDVDIPLGQITVCTGPSGSGKSSFAFDTIHAEGSRRYIESLSHYAQQFVKSYPKAHFDQIDGLPASIAIEQKSHAGTPRSTLGTMTEIYDFLRLLFCHLGIPHCPITKEPLSHITKETIANTVMSWPLGSKIYILTPSVLKPKETFVAFAERMMHKGITRIWIKEQCFELDNLAIPWQSEKESWLVLDRIILEEKSRFRIVESIDQALALCKERIGFVVDGIEKIFVMGYTTPSTGELYPSITPHTFSFNTEQGMCPNCLGLGYQYGAMDSLIEEIANYTAVDLLKLLCKSNLTDRSLTFLSDLLIESAIPINIAIQEMSPQEQKRLFEGAPPNSSGIAWKGIHPLLVQYAKNPSGNMHYILSHLLQKSHCSACDGTRLSPLARHVLIDGISLGDLSKRSLNEIVCFLNTLASVDHLKDVMTTLHHKLAFCIQLGLGYLSLDRGAQTLSHGETQRVRLSSQLSNGLGGCLYVLDEPTVGLHPHDNHLLNQALMQLKKLGNTLLLVEHDPMTMHIADHLLDFGPGAGKQGGHIVAKGSLKEILQNDNSPTGLYLSHKRHISIPRRRRQAVSHLFLNDISLHNIHHQTLSMPTCIFGCITGVSGAGKSTLLMQIVRQEAEKEIASKHKIPSDLIQGLHLFDTVIALTQDPIGTTNRADIATYTDLLTQLRHFYAALPDAKARGLEPKHFSYHHKKGMCLSCYGLGEKLIPLHFLPSVRVPCDTCHGLRLQPLALSISYKEKNLGEVLQLSIDKAAEFFSAFPRIMRILRTLSQVGLSYLTLGQGIATLSGGEAQRLRLSKELNKRSTGKTLYLFDEPSRGLHACDLEKLLPIFHSLVENGNTLWLIEHNLDVIAQADYLIDMGPGAGPHGGSVVAMGTPEEIAKHPSSKISPFLKDYLINCKITSIPIES